MGMFVITNGRQEVHARTLTSVCKSGIHLSWQLADLNVLSHIYNSVKSYLSNRRIKCSDQLFEPHHCSYGVSQVSVLGPLLFLLYTTSQLLLMVH